jgi:hypothetical protein
MASQTIRFAFIREGSSDDGLLPHLETLLVRHGFDEAVGAVAQPPGKTLGQKPQHLLRESPDLDAIFIHRDSDSRSAEQRYREIDDALREVIPPPPTVGVVPVQATEAWLLLDETSIRHVVGRPRGKTGLGLPPPGQVENQARPKELLKEALLLASEATGRRRAAEKKRFDQRRRTLLERLDIDGPITGLSSWQRLVADVRDLVGRPGRVEMCRVDRPDG